MNLFLLIFFSLFVISTCIYIYNRNYVFGIVYALLFIYCFFTMIAYLYFPEKLNLESFGQYYGEQKFIKFIIYIFVSFIFTFIYYIFLSNIKIKTLKINFVVRDNKNKVLNKLFLAANIIWLMVLSYNLLINYNALSYYTQNIMKDNKIWFFLYAASPVFIVAIYSKVCEKIKLRKKFIYIFLLFWAVAIFLITSFRSGQRIELFCLALSIITYISAKYELKINRNNIKNLSRIAIVLVCFIFLFQIIRNNRASFFEISKIDFSIDYFLDLFNIEELIFQDYVTPSLTLLTSMEYKIIAPLEIVKSTFLNSLIIFDYPMMGETISRLLVPNGTVGVGYYYFTEGYNIIGMFGCMLSPLILVLSYELYKRILYTTNDKNFNQYISAVISCYIISIVRGGSLFLFKGILFYVIPFIFLYVCSTNKKLVFVKK